MAEIRRDRDRRHRGRRLLAHRIADRCSLRWPGSASSPRCSARSNTEFCPTICAREQLPAANALIEGATFIAILTGTIAGGLADQGGGDVACPVRAGDGVRGGLLALGACSIPPTGSGAPDLKVRANIAASTAAMLRYLRSDPRLWWGALVTSWFWLVGIVALSLLPPMVKLIGRRRRGYRHRLSGDLLGRGRHRLGACGADRARPHRAHDHAGRRGAARRVRARSRRRAAGVRCAGRPARTGGGAGPSLLGSAVAIDLFGLAVAGGLYIVPVFAAVQAWAGADYRARTIAAVNILNAAFMTGATVVGRGAAESRRHAAGAVRRARRARALLVAAAIWRTMPRG